MTDIPGLHATGRKPKDVKVRIFSNPKLPDHQQMDGSRTLTFNTDQDLDGVRDSLEDMINRFGPAYSEDIDYVSKADLIDRMQVSQIPAFERVRDEIWKLKEDHDAEPAQQALNELEAFIDERMDESIESILVNDDDE